MIVATDKKDEFSLAKVLVLNWLMLACMVLGGWYFWSPYAAKGILIGGVIANVSFYLLKKDLIKVLNGPLGVAKVKFFIKYYVRLTILALVLYYLVRYRSVHIIGLLAGLSTVLLSIGITVAGTAKKIYSTAKEAA